MRDFIFADLGESVPANNVIFRTDAMTSSSENFTVHQITGLDDVTWDQQKKAALLAIGKKQTTRQTLINYAALYSLNLISQKTDGSNAVTLVTATNDSDTESW